MKETTDTLQAIVTRIRHGLTGDAERDRLHLMSSMDFYKDHPDSREIAKECGRMMAETLSGQELAEWERAMKADEQEKQVAGADMLKNQYPGGLIRQELLKEKSLGEGAPNLRYFILTQKYKSYLETYLKEKLPLDRIDQYLKKSELDFRALPESKQDYYQKTSGMGLAYLYLRSNLYIEKLTLTELRLLDAKEEYDNEVKAFLDSTVERVVNPYDETHIIFYGPENGKFMCDSNEIVIGIRYDEFETELEASAFTRNFVDKLRTISQIGLVLEIVGLESFRKGVRVIQYNEASVFLPQGSKGNT